MSRSRPCRTGQVVVDHVVDDRPENGAGAAREQLGPLLDVLSGLDERTPLAVPHGDHEIRPDEEEDLAERHGLLAIDVTRRLDHDEQGVVVHLELGPLVSLERVLDGELVELERGFHLRELLFRRLVESQPHERAWSLRGLERLFERERAGAADAGVVDAAVDDHATGLTKSALRGLADGRPRTPRVIQRERQSRICEHQPVPYP